MIAAAALGDIVKQRGEIGELLTRQRLHDLAQSRELVVELGHRKAPQVAHHEQRVRVHRVGVEEIVLHAPDDSPEGGDVTAEDAVQVHAPQFMRDADGCAQNLHEQAVMPGVLPKLFVDEPHMRADQANRFRAHAAQLRMLLQEHEQFQQCRGEAGEHLGMRDFQIIVSDLEARIDGDRRSALRENGLAKQLQQHFVQEADIHHGAVVLLHQLFDGEGETRVLVAEQLRQFDLVIEQQPILAPPREHVQAETHFPQEGLARLEFA
jgi:hypothetical protein